MTQLFTDENSPLVSYVAMQRLYTQSQPDSVRAPLGRIRPRLLGNDGIYTGREFQRSRLLFPSPESPEVLIRGLCLTKNAYKFSVG